MGPEREMLVVMIWCPCAKMNITCWRRWWSDVHMSGSTYHASIAHCSPLLAPSRTPIGWVAFPSAKEGQLNLQSPTYCNVCMYICGALSKAKQFAVYLWIVPVSGSFSWWWQSLVSKAPCFHLGYLCVWGPEKKGAGLWGLQHSRVEGKLATHCLRQSLSEFSCDTSFGWIFPAVILQHLPGFVCLLWSSLNSYLSSSRGFPCSSGAAACACSCSCLVGRLWPWGSILSAAKEIHSSSRCDCGPLAGTSLKFIICIIHS